MSAAGTSGMERFSGWNEQAVQVAEAAAPSENLLRSAAIELRYTMVVFGYQILLRIWLFAKRWNY
ncbi:MAG TPA: hypothetical protein VG033_02440 [Candidatus Acidoferrales bacterium]|jgi:hypothetical protein|nr:hypothetical protein [Candidatus Acidoferrales bacterium]